MAQIKLIFACLLLKLIFSQEIQPIEGRHLKLETTKDVPKLQTQSNFLVKETIKTAEHISSLHGDDMTNSKAVHASESAPSQVINESWPPPHQGHVDDFRPTTPGHSPGVGNFLQKETGKIINADHISNLHGDGTINKALVHGSESSPPAPSQVINQPQAPPLGHQVDDFRPTSPGHSPGVGHFLQN